MEKSTALGIGFLGGIVIGPFVMAVIILVFCMLCFCASTFMALFIGTKTADYTTTSSPSSSILNNYDTLINIRSYIGRNIADVSEEEGIKIVNNSLDISNIDYSLHLVAVNQVINKADLELNNYSCPSTGLEDNAKMYMDLAGLNYWIAVKNDIKSETKRIVYSYDGNELSLRCGENDNVVVTISK